MHPKIRCPQGRVQPTRFQIVHNPNVWLLLSHMKIRCQSYHLTPSYVSAHSDLVYILLDFTCQSRFLCYFFQLSEWGQQTSHKKWCDITHIKFKLWLTPPEKWGGAFITIPKDAPFTLTCYIIYPIHLSFWLPYIWYTIDYFSLVVVQPQVLNSNVLDIDSKAIWNIISYPSKHYTVCRIVVLFRYRWIKRRLSLWYSN